MTPLSHGWKRIQVYLPEEAMYNFRTSPFYNDMKSDSRNVRDILYWLSNIGDSESESLVEDYVQNG